MSSPSSPSAPDHASKTADSSPPNSSSYPTKHRNRIIRNATAEILKQIGKIKAVEAACGGEAICGLLIQTSGQPWRAYGHEAFTKAAQEVGLTAAMEKRLFDPDVEPADEGPDVELPVLAPLSVGWREKTALWGGAGLRSIVTRLLHELAFPNTRVSYNAEARPPWWPAHLRYASPTGPKAIGVEGTAEFRTALISVIEAGFAHANSPVDKTSPSSSSPPPAPAPATPPPANCIDFDDSRTPMGLASGPTLAALASPLAVATGAAAASTQKAGKQGGGSEVLAIEVPTLVKPPQRQSSVSERPARVSRRQAASGASAESGATAVSGATAAPESAVPMEHPDHVATDDMIIRVVRIIRANCGDELAANHPPATLACLHDREEAPFHRVPNIANSAIQIHHQPSPEHWLVSGLAEGRVFVWDSARLRESAAVRREVAGLYGDVAGNRDGVVHVRHYNPILQRGGAVCGFLASAFAIDAAQGLLPHQRIYGQAAAKDAVLDVLRTGRLKPCSVPRTRTLDPWKEYAVASHCCGASGGGEVMAACDDCGRWWHIKAACLPFLRPAERALFVRSQGNDDALHFVCCAPASSDSSPAPSDRDIFDEY